MNPTIEERSYLDTTGIAFSNSFYEAVVLPERGSNLIRLRHKPRDVRILREPESAKEFKSKRFEFGTPVLFFPNRIEDGSFVFEGRTYRFPITDAKTNCHMHGFLHDRVWKVDSTSAEGDERARIALSLAWGRRKDELGLFPHFCLFRLDFLLTEIGVRQEFSVENQGQAPMPMGFGYHTSFLTPKSEDYVLEVPPGKEWLMNGRFFPTGELVERGVRTFSLNRTTGRIFRHFSLERKAAEGGGMFEAGLRNLRGGFRIVYRFEGAFGHLVLWNKQGEDGFTCVEPQTCAVNAFNMDLPAATSGRMGLEGGGVFRAVTTLGLEEVREEGKT